ncbi:glucosamine-6-phosphate deaminase [Mucilaginibacter sabulilitoris]|uniref:Glucosamine-6-phosphate deaminase n=1 Tax=Mucilaginibacter sabulilitoris TaxID=1173583 RepID=A0ABZ0TTG2_9SPHI|nr:glucosamine-6-phosphate deaminase [Mucilaginibacter sabulilitoris]WPU96362.1 glucosamine-6-phosphate deaminase [Mucilaginibacter sabulilitoris]
MLKEIKKEKLRVLVFENRTSLGQVAAKMVAKKINQLLQAKPVINIIFAAAPSQNEFLDALINEPDIEWQKINAFHMDEYLGLPPAAPELFSSFLKKKIFSRVPFAWVNYINGSLVDCKAECERYTQLLLSNPADIVCMGIGENTHIAFNDPHVADFNDPETVKLVQLDLACRQQQVNDGCFDTLNDVPEYALTLTIPALMSASHVFCMVPGVNKAQAVKYTLEEPVSEHYPSTILKTHDHAVLFVDTDSFSKIAAYNS